MPGPRVFIHFDTCKESIAMIRSKCLPALLAATLGCAVSTLVMAQGSPAPGATSTSPGTAPFTGGSFPPGSGVPSTPVPMGGSSSGGGSGVGSGTGSAVGSGSTGGSTGSGAYTTPPGGGVTPGTVPAVDQTELARCNAMLSAAREQCVSDLRARSMGGSGASTGGAAGTGIYPPPANRQGATGSSLDAPGAPPTRLP